MTPSTPDARAPRLSALLLAFAAFATGCSGPAPDALLGLARQAAEAGDQRTATIHLLNLLEQQPGNTEALVLLGRMYLDRADARTADRLFLRAAQGGADPAPFLADWLRALLQLGRADRVLELTSGLAPDQVPVDLLALRAYALQTAGRFGDAETLFRAAVARAPDRPTPRADLAQLLLVTGRDAAGAQEISLALGLDGTHPPALILRGARQFAAGDIDDATRSYEQAAAGAASGYPVLVWVQAMTGLAEIRIYADDPDEAERLLDEVAARIGERLPVRYLRAQISAQRGSLELARTQLQSILGDFPGHAPSQRLLGSIYVVEGSLNLAELYLKMALNSDALDPLARGMLAAVRLRQDQPEAALEVLEESGPIDVNARKSFLALAGQASLQSGNLDRALEYFEAGADAYPDDWRFTVGQALAYLGALRTDEAILLLKDVEDRADPEVRGTVLVLSYVQKGDFAAADRVTLDLLDRYGKQAWPHNLRGAWLLQRQEYAGAADSFARSYAIEANADAATGLAEARVSGGLDGADELLADWLARDPDDLATLHALGQVTLASNQLEKARDYYERVVAVDTQHVGALNNLAWIYQELGDRRALEVGRAAFKLAANNLAVVDTLGWSLLQFDEPAEGRRLLERAHELDPDDPEVRFHLAIARVRTGDERQGRELLAALLDSGEEFPSRDAAQKAMRTL